MHPSVPFAKVTGVVYPAASVVIDAPPKVRNEFVPKVIVMPGLNPEPVTLITSPTWAVAAFNEIAAVATVNVADSDSTPSDTVTV